MAEDQTDEHGLPLWPAAERNKQPIAEVLERVLPERGRLLEIASGTGQHALHFASALPGYTIVPSDCDPENLATLRRRVGLADNPRLLPPLELDVTGALPDVDCTAVFCANMVHIAPWSASIGLFRVAAHVLPAGGLLVTYGPYSFHGEHTADSNARFDRSLKDRNPELGVRDVDALEAVAGRHGFLLGETHAMPANNFVIVWKKS